ncbi:MAG: arginine--tRNA ligase [Deltaproteobacteria bacterium]
MRDLVRALVRDALERARQAGRFTIEGDLPEPLLEAPREAGHGELASNIAMLLAGQARQAPRDIAAAIIDHLHDPEGLIAEAEVAGPGFLNLTLSASAWRGRLLEVLEAGDSYGSVDCGRGLKVQVEFVSANPTGPLHIGHGRGAATGDALARILAAAGYQVSREYYVNDAGRQMEVLGRSVLVRYRELCGEDSPFPDDGYPGEYIKDLAAEILERDGKRWLDADQDEAVEALSGYAGARMLEVIRSDLDRFGVDFDAYTSECALRESGKVDEAIEALASAGHVYDKDGARWFRSSGFGDDKDRALVKSNGELTYFASDIGYHREKLRQGWDWIIDVWGADHHGYVKRIEAGLEALGENADRFSVVLVQMVNLTRDGEPVRMGKRSGEFVALADVLDEVGPDLARFFFLMRKSDAQLEFDLELARRQSAENPVFYVQYAHTRIAGIFRSASEKSIAVPEPSDQAVARLGNADEIGLIRVLDEFPAIVEAAANSLEPHRIVFYAQRLAGDFHRFYTRNRCVSDDADLTVARLLLVTAVKQVIGRALRLVGVGTPERM